jgi:hypothetical protein
MSWSRLRFLLIFSGMMLCTSNLPAQRPYIGYVYPAGGRQESTFQVRLGGQGLDEVNGILVSGEGVQGKVVEYLRKLGPQETTLLNEQMAQLKKMPQEDAAAQDIISRIRRRLDEYVQRPASASISSLLIAEITVTRDARPGTRELRLVTARGISNPLMFCVGQFPEFSRKPMKTSNFQVLGKEELALRKRPPEEVEDRVTPPCTLNGQIASGEVNRYRFEARQGQKLVISTDARRLIPFIADAVPGWFQPVVTVYDAKGKELAFSDDYRFKPDPVLLFEVPRDGEYTISIADSLYRGREDFVYRITIGQLPFLTSLFPPGRPNGSGTEVQMKGWNLDGAELNLPAADSGTGVFNVTACKDGIFSNAVPFAIDALPECIEEEPNDDAEHAQHVNMPAIVNGRINRSDDGDVFEVSAKAGDTIVAEVSARKLDSPLDSLLKITDAGGKVIACNDDHPDADAGVNTHHADSYLMTRLTADGKYFVHIGDTAQSGGEEYGYRLRISAPQPDFALRVVPSSLAFRGKSGNSLSVYAIRKDGFDGEIKLNLRNAPDGFKAAGVNFPANQEMVRFGVKSELSDLTKPVELVVEGRAKLNGQEIAHDATPAEDRMQAFLWRHLVPAASLPAMVFDPNATPAPKRVFDPSKVEKKQEPSETKETAPPAGSAPANTKFTKQQVASRLKQLKILFEEGLLTDAFYGEKVAECEAMK